jgi:hypothetical protein
LLSPDYHLFIDRELVGIRWRCATPEAANTLYPRLIAHARTLSTELFIAIILGPDCPPPDQQTRDALLRGHDRLYPYCRDTRMVVLGDGVRQQVLRGVITSMTLVAALRGRPFHRDAQLGGLLAAISATLGREPATTLAQLHTRGLLSAAELADLDPQQAGSRPS